MPHTLTPAEHDSQLAGAALSLLLAAGPGPLSREELHRALAADLRSATERLDTDRALDELHRLGLTHEASGLFFASRAARRSAELKEA